MSNRYKASIFSSTAATSTSSAASGVWKLSDIAQAITAGLWPVAAAANDALFNYVSLLMPFDSTNGKTNNTFLDSSTNNFTITRNGTPTQGTFTPFSQTGWGGYFGTKTDFLSTPAVSLLTTFTGDFTFECWVNPTSAAVTEWGIWDSRQTGSTAAAMVFSLSPLASPVSGSYRLLYYNGSYNYGTSTVLSNQWTHVAFVRSGSTMTFYVNGAVGGTSTISGTQTGTATTNPVYIGSKDGSVSNFGTVGYISNFRIVNGVAVYTGAFTPPTSPLAITQSSGTNIAAITGTQTSLLTLQSNYFKDNSANAFAITVVGTTSIQAFSPFLPTAAYDAATNGGTGYFNGTTDSLSAPANAAFSFTGDFTIEAWVYYTSVAAESDIASNYVSNVATDWTIVKPAANTFQWYPSSAASFVNSGITPTVNTWYHIAAVRSGTTCSLYVNGVSGGTPLTFSGTLGDAVKAVRVGARSASNYFPGYISGARIVKGTAVYTANFTPPTAPLTAITNTSLLLSGTNAGAIDNAAKNVAITNSSAQISTAISKWGGSSLFCSLAADKLTIPDAPLLRFGTGDFTIEGWIYLNNASALRNIVSKGNTTTTGWTVGISSLNRIFATFSATTITGTVATLAANTWYYFAFVRSGTATGNIKLYINGTLEASSATAITTDFNQTDALYIASNRTGTTPAFDGYIDDIRITKSARTVTTTPTAAFSLQ